MADIFDARIFCDKCGKRMKKGEFFKNGFRIRIMECRKCGVRIQHPGDVAEYKQFLSLKKKPFHVKLRIVGNSYAVSIPKEIIDFVKEQEDIADEFVSLCMEEAGKLSLFFNDVRNIYKEKMDKGER